MYVKKRSGKLEAVSFNKILKRIQVLSGDLDKRFVDPDQVAQQVVGGLYDGVSTEELDRYAAETSAAMTVYHPDYALLAGRILMSNLHKQTNPNIGIVARKLHDNISRDTNEATPLITRELYELIVEHQDELNRWLLETTDNDYTYDYFAYKTLEKSYLMKVNGKIVERPQHMLMRVALGIHGSDLKSARLTFMALSNKTLTHATPTLFNAGTPRPQMSSCFLLGVEEDSVDGIFDTVKSMAKISQNAGGIGLHVSNIRGNNSYIRGTNGRSNGVVPFMKVMNETMRAIDQGGGKRKGSAAIYIEPWHVDFLDVIRCKIVQLKEEKRCLDLFPAAWVPDLFVERMLADEEWSFFCPNESPDLAEVWGDEFVELYEKYEAEGRARGTMRARDLWSEIIKLQLETGVPYIVFKDHCNRKSNQQALGTIKSSNLCVEIVEFSGKNAAGEEEIAVCNLGSLSLPAYVAPDGTFDFAALRVYTKILAKNLDKIIDLNYYPLEAMRRSNLKHRPIGIGIQGLADVFHMMKLPYASPEARELNRKISATMYYAAIQASCELAQEKGAYWSFRSSPMALGQFQFDLWNVEPDPMYDWDKLREEVMKHGLRNSLSIALMPTASTSNILGNNECFEPYTTNLYTRYTLSGQHTIVNKHLVRDLIEIGVWDEEMRNDLMRMEGSVQAIDRIPQALKERYKTAFEIEPTHYLQMSADRGPYVCQSQSLNLFFDRPSKARLSKSHVEAWKLGLKTAMYYMRTPPSTSSKKFTIVENENENEVKVCSILNPDCESCSG